MNQIPLTAVALSILLLMSACDGPDTPSTSYNEGDGQRQSTIPERTPSDSGPLVAYRGATLINGTGSSPVENTTVFVRGEKIVAAGTDIRLPAGVEIVNVEGKWIVPGLIDAHVHFMTSGRLYTRRPSSISHTLFLMRKKFGGSKVECRSHYAASLCSGVTSVVSMEARKSSTGRET